MSKFKEYASIGLQVLGAVLVIVGLFVWLGTAAAWIAGGITLLVMGVLLGMNVEYPVEEVTADGEGAGEVH